MVGAFLRVVRMSNAGRLIISLTTRLVVCAGLLAVGVGVLMWLVSTRPTPVRQEEGVARPEVPVMRAGPVEVRRRWSGFGTVRAIDVANVTAEVTAQVVERPAGMLGGRVVEAGDVLARLDSSDFEAQAEVVRSRLDELDAQLAQIDVDEANLREQLEMLAIEREVAERELERVREAQQRGVAKDREVDEARRAFAAARRAETNVARELASLPAQTQRLQAQRAAQSAELRQIERDIQRCVIRSPIDGVLQEIDVTPGRQMSPGRQVARVVKLERLEVPVQLPGYTRSRVRLGDEVEVRAGERRGGAWYGRIVRIAPEHEQATRTMTAFVEIEQDASVSDALAPGTFVQAEVISQTVERRYVVPRRALRGESVLVIEDESIALRDVEVEFELRRRFPQFGVDDEFWVVLARPLPSETLVVLDGMRSIPLGTRVNWNVAGPSDESGRLGRE